MKNKYEAASFHIGEIYCCEGQGVKTDWKQAFQWFQKAASIKLHYSSRRIKKCCFRGQCFLGFFYLYGVGGIPSDFKLALRWLIKAANGGVVEAMFEVALIYILGIGVQKQYKLAQ